MKHLLAYSLIFIFCFVSGKEEYLTAQSNSHSISIGQNYRIYPSNVTQSETFIVKSPVNPNILFASANTISTSPFFISEGIYVTINGGMSWYGSDTCKGGPLLTAHYGDPGITIDKDGRFILVRRGAAPFNGVYSHFSTDNGITWSNQRTITTANLERATIASDNNPSSNFYGRTYTVWVPFVGSPHRVYFSSTINGAESWADSMRINNPPLRCQTAEVKVGVNGEVYSCWGGVMNASPFTELHVGFAKSLDGGSSWNVQEVAYAMNGIQGLMPQKGNIRVNGLPRMAVDESNGSRRGWIYIVTCEKNLAPAGNDPDIIMHRSTDGGNTWSAGIRVNQDPINNGKIQFFPGIEVDDNGGLNIIYYDDRNTTSDSSGVFLSRSTNGGDTFHDYQISDHNFKPVPISGFEQGYMGDNIDITSTNNTLWPVWMDNSTGIYQIWTVPIDIASIGINQISTSIPGDYELKQNYPNPFNPSTIIGFSIPRAGFVSLKIFDINGKEIANLVNENLNPGEYNYELQISNYEFSSGVYFYSLQSEGRMITKSMVVLK
jgi:hypothetical protein